MRTFYDRNKRDCGDSTRELVIGIAVLLLILAALGLVGGPDYEDRCAALYPASIEEVR